MFQDAFLLVGVARTADGNVYPDFGNAPGVGSHDLCDGQGSAFDIDGVEIGRAHV